MPAYWPSTVGEPARVSSSRAGAHRTWNRGGAAAAAAGAGRREQQQVRATRPGVADQVRCRLAGELRGDLAPARPTAICWSSSAATPAANGLAIEVPLVTAVAVGRRVAQRDDVDAGREDVDARTPARPVGRVVGRVRRRDGDCRRQRAGVWLHAGLPSLPAATTTVIPSSITAWTAASSTPFAGPPMLRLSTAGWPGGMVVDDVVQAEDHVRRAGRPVAVEDPQRDRS